ncbi:MAG: hypothetical protein ACI9VT_003720 [Psychroserpens sp.]|jgi:hypothetical protein
MGSAIKREVILNDLEQVSATKDVAISFEEADRIAGFRLDRRRNYCVIDNEVRQLARWTQACSGCADDSEYSSSTRGSGCGECGYHGVVRSGWYEPVAFSQD